MGSGFGCGMLEGTGRNTNIENSFKLIAILSYRYSILFYLLFYLFPIRQISSPIFFFCGNFHFSLIIFFLSLSESSETCNIFHEVFLSNLSSSSWTA